MKIGYYFPTIKEESFESKSPSFDITPLGISPFVISPDFRPVESLNTHHVIHEDEIALDFVLSLIDEGNINITNDPDIEFDISSKNINSFESSDGLKEYLTLTHLHHQIKKDYLYTPPSIDALLSKIYNDHQQTLPNFSDIIQDSSISYNRSIQDLVLTPIDDRLKSINPEFHKIIQKKTYRQSLRGALIELLGNSLGEGIFPISGFKISKELFEEEELYSRLGYPVELDEYGENFELPYAIHEYIDVRRDSSLDLLNEFYSVDRTNDPKDILYLCIKRSFYNSESMRLVFQSSPCCHDVGHHSSNFVYFNRIEFWQNWKSQLNTSEEDLVIRVTDSDQSILENRLELNGKYGVLKILGPDGQSIDNHPELETHLYGVLRSCGIRLEGWQFTKKISGNRYQVEYLPEQCAYCLETPCSCETIRLWREYRDWGMDNGEYGVEYYGFKHEFFLEHGIYPLPDEVDVYSQWMPDYTDSSNYNDGLNWRNYNDQLDMDQQDPSFWG